jgi:hypothetical protein
MPLNEKGDPSRRNMKAIRKYRKADSLLRLPSVLFLFLSHTGYVSVTSNRKHPEKETEVRAKEEIKGGTGLMN